MDTIGDRIKSIRKNEGLKQTDFARRVLVSASYISKLESNKEIPSEVFTKLLSLEYDVPYLWLKEGTGDMKIGEISDDFYEYDANSEFRKLCMSEIHGSIRKILAQELSDNKKDLLMEMLKEYLRNMEELTEKLQTFKTDNNYDSKSAFYVTSSLKSIERIFYDLTELMVE